ncbi:phosphatase PAP2 family protein [Prevotella sp. OH937_COT-195]|uniref:phosphatase PAP2 family protein n=1 Tax=Prevotella sp. OH937_COT-195 TaxID=2491051 RepID=UPI000F651E7D|nr:phosphatase PAP2 family protein [Prevotella sp. OH937_COT-195]RRC99865.1 phosphatase PAP2 family protein [Prevotella sp. OH937_COT-195]
MNKIKKYLSTEKPLKGLMAVEWVVTAYLVLTTIVILFCYTDAVNPVAMLTGRARVVATTAALWFIYRLWPCRMTRFLRIAAQMALLSWWYPDTYEINRMFPNLDHVFAEWEQSLFGFQPALLFHEAMPGSIFSELMDLGYASYYPMIFLVVLFYFVARYDEFHNAAFVVLGSFFLYYVIFIFVPVVGPTFYYHAVGIDQISNGIFPDLGTYFNNHQECLPSPGDTDGVFYRFVESAKEAGERPTAAFPSSHVGCSTVLMLLAWHSKKRWLVWTLMPFYVLLCFSTVYIQAHYAIDAFAGLATGVVFYFMLYALSKRVCK